MPEPEPVGSRVPVGVVPVGVVPVEVVPVEVVPVETTVGLARVHLTRGDPARLLMLGHGAGGGLMAPDLVAVRAAAVAQGWTVGLVEQPYRVRGRRVAEAASRLDTAWREICAPHATSALYGTPALHARHATSALHATPGILVTGGRSSGARVACRTATQVGAAGVLCLAFPLQPPGGPTRLHELALPVVPRLVVQGGRDVFGMPQAAAGVAVHAVRGGDHAFGVRHKDHRSAAEIATEIGHVAARWLGQVSAGEPTSRS